MKIMVVDDDRSVTLTLQEILRTRGHEVKYYNNSSDALIAFSNNPSDVVLSDLNMPGMDGFALINELKQADHKVDIVVITGYPTAENAVKAMQRGAFDFIKKPFQADEIDAVLERVSQKKLLVERIDNIQDEVTKLEELNRRLTVFNQVKDNFINNVSHELRTPLTILLSAVSLLKSQDGSGIQDVNKKLLEMIDNGAKRLNNVIESVFDLTLENSYKKQESEFDVNEVHDNVISQFMDDISRKGITIKKNLEAPDKILFDRKLFERILYHLVSNAVKFNMENGSIEICIRVTASEIHIRVSDTGIGIPKEEQDNIFDRFYQIDGGIKREHGGMGIGLAAAKKYTDLLGGKIEVNSQPGQGSTFTVTLKPSKPV